MQSTMSDPAMAFQFCASNVPIVSSAPYHVWDRVSSRWSVLATRFGWVHLCNSMPICGLDESGKRGPALSHHTFTIWGNCCLVKQYMPSKTGKYGIKSGQHAKLGPTTPGTCRCTSATLLVGCQERTRVCVWCVMTAGLKRHNTTCHNFFTSYALRQKWLARTVRRNKDELLSSAGNKEIAQVSSKPIANSNTNFFVLLTK